MLTALEVADGQRVLEVGTGSSWNAALLAARLGSGNVTTVEVDPVLARKAAKVIEEAGYSPAVVWGDGARGWEAGAPYDRIIATCSVRRIPYAWVRQTKPGGRILAPLAGDFWSGALVPLDVGGDGVASGRFVGGARFMPTRSERPGPDLPVDSGTGRRGGGRQLSDLAPRWERVGGHGDPGGGVAVRPTVAVGGGRCRARRLRERRQSGLRRLRADRVPRRAAALAPLI
ncbi:hypothetical protein [Streptomyces sp. Inha503]|uniref:hypothetical protein n=1 Tax=Streptomyces sp. Inha503 TaxID=3383314 RepID=UPI0039A1ECEE